MEREIVKMRKKDIESKIVGSLEDVSPLNSQILNAAKEEMKECKKKCGKRNVFKYAFVCFVCVILSVAIILTVKFVQKDNSGVLPDGYSELAYTSMSDYFTEHGIAVTAYDRLFDDGLGTESGNSGSDHYVSTGCNVVFYNGEEVCITENYDFYGTDKITVSILLSDKGSAEKDLFEEYIALQENMTVMGTEIEYSFDEKKSEGKAKFVYKEYKIYMNFVTSSKSSMISHLQTFIILQ